MADTHSIAAEAMVRLSNAAFRGLPVGDIALPETEEQWEELFTLASRHNVAPLVSSVLPGLDKVPATVKVKFATLQQQAADHYDTVREIATELSDTFIAEGIKVMILKGLSLSRLYPQPQLRKFSDLDIYLLRASGMPASKEGEHILVSKLGATPSKTSYHHNSYTYRGVYVENHFSFTSEEVRRSGKAFEQLLRSELLKGSEEDSQFVYGSPDFKALFLMRHSSVHFEKANISLRHLYDWMAFLQKDGDKVNWDFVCKQYRRFGMGGFVSVMMTLIEEKMGWTGAFAELNALTKEAAPDRGTVERVWDDILFPVLDGERRSCTVCRWCSSFSGRLSRRWKHKLCSSDCFIVDLAYASAAAVKFALKKKQ